MPEKFCPKCGEEDTNFYKGICLECYKEEHEFTKAPEEVEITECRECGYWKNHDKWKEPDKKIIKDLALKKMDIDLNRTNINTEMDEDTLKVKVEGKADPQGMIPVEKEHEIDIDFNEKLCTACLRRKNKDYRVKIQLRKKQEEPSRGKTEEIHDPEKFKDIKKHIEETTSKEMDRDHKALASWRTKKENGWNYYYGYTEIGKRVLNEVIEEFGLTSTKSIIDAGQDQSGKNKTRKVHCIRA